MNLYRASIRATAERHFDETVLLLLAAFVVLATMIALQRWEDAHGYEPEWIATALASGHGFSFDGDHRWLFEGMPSDAYFPSAWSDPLFTLLYAGLIYVFGEESHLVIMLLSLVFFSMTVLLVAYTSKRLAGPWAGLIAVLLLLTIVQGHAIRIGNEPLAGLWVALLLFYFVRSANTLTLKKSTVLGAILGLSILTASNTMTFVSVAVLLIFWFVRAPWPAARMSAATVLAAVLIVIPWTWRNYLVFDEFVPVRNGLGSIAHVGTVALGKTFAPESVATPLPVPWTSSGPLEATARVVAGSMGERTPFDRRALEAWQRDVMEAQHGPEYASLNEAQRDRWYLGEAIAFVLANPLRTAQLAVVKLGHFIGPSPLLAALTVFGLLGGLVLAFRQRLLIVPIALAAAYSAPFAIITPYFYRYRYPIEPVLALLVGVAAVHVGQALSTRWQHYATTGGASRAAAKESS